jgi:hypothetical protein
VAVPEEQDRKAKYHLKLPCHSCRNEVLKKLSAIEKQLSASAVSLLKPLTYAD